MPTTRRGERGPLRIALEDWIKTYNLPPEVRSKFAGALSGIEHDLTGYMRAVLPGLGIPQNEVNLLVSRLGRLQGSENIGTFLGLFVMVVVGSIAASQAFAEPFIRFASYTGNSSISNKRLTPSEAMQAMFRGTLSIADWSDTLKAYGHSNENAARLESIYRPRLNETEVIQALWRGSLSESGFRDYLSKKGWTPDDINAWREFGNSIPGISDSMRFLVRDVYREDVVAKYGYDEGWPVGPVIELAAKQGYSAEFVRSYWRAHFILPSPTQAAEMVHRAGLPLHEYNELLRISDYPPYWRKYFERLVYTPLTRVDIRRVYNVLHKDRNWLIARHKEIGYDDENAATLADFTIANQKDKSKDLSKADLMAAYREGAIDRNAASGAIQALGYDANEADILLRRVDRDIQQEALRDEIELVHQRFLADLINDATARSALANLGQSATRIEAFMLRWNRDKEIKPRLPTRADAEVFAKKGIITVDEYNDFLIFLGYPEKYRAWYIREVTGQKPA